MEKDKKYMTPVIKLPALPCEICDEAGSLLDANEKDWLEPLNGSPGNPLDAVGKFCVFALTFCSKGSNAANAVADA